VSAAATAPDFMLASIDGGAVALHELLGEAPVVLLFVHADCPTARLTLTRLAGARGEVPLVVVAQEPPDETARLARRTGLPGRWLAEPAPFAVSEAYGVVGVPTAVRVERDGAVAETVVGWNQEALARILQCSLPDEAPRWKPGCQARNTYDPALLAQGTTGFDELEDMFERGWTDGLPAVPPTPERVEAMLGGRDPSRSLGLVPPAFGEATLERVAACAVLAGCRPEYFPVMIAAVEAALDESFNLHGQAVTTSPPGQIVIVNGPVREAIGLNSGMGALGPGSRANLTIGRALRLVVTLTGGGRPGGLDRATLGHPGKLSFCLAEDEEASPWEPLHAERGLPRGTSAVTLLAGDSPLSVSDHRSTRPDKLAATLGWAAASQWSPFWWPLEASSLFVVCPEHAALFANAGWSKRRAREAIFEAVAKPAVELNRGETTPLVKSSDPRARIHKWASPEEILLVVAGGEAGRFSAVVGPSLGMDAAVVTREIEWST
jgi:peroxiredoxin